MPCAYTTEFYSILKKTIIISRKTCGTGKANVARFFLSAKSRFNIKLEGVYIKREQEKIIGEDKITHFLSYAESRIKYTLIHTHTPASGGRGEEQVKVVG